MTNQDLKASTQAHDAVLGTGNARSRLLPVEEARSRIVAMMRVLGSERVDLASAMGRVLAEDIVARLAHPPTAVSAMDGYALCSGDIAGLPARLRKIGVAKAGAGFGGLVEAGARGGNFTGAPVPDGADTIALQEDAVERDNSVELSSVPKPGRHIRAAGLD